MGTNSLHAIILFVALLCSLPKTMGCIHGEREALLEFKAGLKDPFGRLSSWAGPDCCNGWQGVECSNSTGHVVRLDLRNTFQRFDSATESIPECSMALGGKISPSLLHLKHLKYLDLSMNYFGGITIPAFIGSLEKLRYLNLSTAGFGGLLPHHLGNLSSLRYLDLSRKDQDAFPDLPSDSNSIYELDALRRWFSQLSYGKGQYAFPDLLFEFPDNFYLDTGRWLSHLSSLQYLNFNFVDLSKASTSVLESLNALSSLSEMHLSRTGLNVPPHLSHVNFTYLRVLDLSNNSINSTIPPWLFQITGLRYLDLSGNSFQSLVPASIGNLTSLRVLHLANRGFLTVVPSSLKNLCMLTILDLSGMDFGGQFNNLGEVLSGCIKDNLNTLSLAGCNLTGHLPFWLGKLKNLKTLDLSYNSFYGPLPASQLLSLQELYLGNNRLNGTLSETLGLLSELVELDLRNNSLEGVLSEAHFSNLNQLVYLDFSSNSLSMAVGSNWDPPPRLTHIRFRSCKLGPAFPAWLRKLENLSSIDMSSAGISDSMPDWFWNFSSTILDIDLSGNELKGVLPVSLRHLNLQYVDLRNNQFRGSIPQFSSTLEELYLSNNSLSGGIYPNIGEIMPGMLSLSVSTNNISGNIPFSICKQKHLITLDLSKNQLSGDIPNCWDHTQELMAMDLSYNSLSGTIPTSVCSLSYFQFLHLRNNDLSGEIPLPFRNCAGIITLDLGQNKFGGSIPAWIGENFQRLETLRLRDNLFHGNIPPELGTLNELKIIDLAHNNLSGTIPLSLGNLSAMKVAHSIYDGTYMGGYVDNIEVNLKGGEYEYDKLLPLLMSIDLAKNNLTGEIPEELAALSGLQNLNLSENLLTGGIPKKISELQWLESLDLSLNKLSGVIPTSMTAMHSLDHLNLSFNRLFGKIPSSGQFGALPDPSIYIGNDNLCGFPLNACQDAATSQPQKLVNNDESDSETIWFYLTMAPGYVVGFWVVIGTLLLNKKWRIAHFRFVDCMYDKLYVALAVNVARMKNRNFFRRG